jgi:DNA-binding MarR family transcriptional regulator
MNPENEITINEIVGAIRRLVKAVYIDAARISRQFGLTGPQSSVLRTLIKTGPISSAEISRRLYVTPANITGIIDRLEKKGLVERIRQREDRRIALITLTASGTELGKTLPDPIETKLISELADLAPGQLQALNLSINQVLSLVDIKEIEERPLAWDQGYREIGDEEPLVGLNK